MSEKGLHPKIISFVQKCNEIEALIVQGNMLRAVETLLATHTGLEPDDFDEEYQKKLYREYHKLEQAKNSTRESYELNVVAKPHYFKLYKQLSDLLWDKKYFNPLKYGVETKKDTTFGKVKPWTEK